MDDEQYAHLVNAVVNDFKPWRGQAPLRTPQRIADLAVQGIEQGLANAKTKP